MIGVKREQLFTIIEKKKVGRYIIIITHVALHKNGYQYISEYTQVDI